MSYAKKDRPLTAILQAEGDETLPDSDVRRKDQLAKNVWELVITGKLSFPDDTEDSGFRTLKASVKDWKDAAQWIYGHVDGPYRIDPTLTEGMAGALSNTPLDELQAIVERYREAGEEGE